MQVVKIKKVFTFWWAAYHVAEEPKLVIGDMALSRPTVALKLASGDYLYIGAERIKEMRFCADKYSKGDTYHGLSPVGRTVQGAGTE